jgi:Ran GTPase-activating protein (RanGAP) involved in mRNA processing and transport
VSPAKLPAGLLALARHQGTEHVSDLMPGDDGVFRVVKSHSATKLSTAIVHGLVALMWIKSEITTLALNECTLSSESLEAMARALPLNLTSLGLGGSDIANGGGDNSGVMQLALVLRSSRCRLVALNLSHNSLGAQAGQVIAEALTSNGSLTSVSLLGNQFDDETVNMLLKLKEEKPNLTTLCGLTHKETKLNYCKQRFGPADAMLLAPEISVMASLTECDLRDNGLKEEGWCAIFDALRDNPRRTSS